MLDYYSDACVAQYYSGLSDDNAQRDFAVRIAINRHINIDDVYNLLSGQGCCTAAIAAISSAGKETRYREAVEASAALRAKRPESLTREELTDIRKSYYRGETIISIMQRYRLPYKKVRSAIDKIKKAGKKWLILI